MRLLHPYMPFVTEALWQELAPRKAGELLMGQNWPQPEGAWVDKDADEAVGMLQQIITGVRAVRKSYGLSHNAALRMHLFGTEDNRRQINEVEAMLLKLAGLESYAFLDEDAPPEGCTPINVKGMSAYLDLRDHLDIEAECGKIDKKIAKLEKQLKPLEGRLSNPKFTEKAPEDVVAKVQSEVDELKRQLETLVQSKADLEKMSAG